MSTSAAKLMRNSFYVKMIESLDCLPANAQEWIKGVQKIFNDAVRNNPHVLRRVPDWFKTGEMCSGPVHRVPRSLEFVPNHLKTKGMCKEAVDKVPRSLEFVPDHLKTQWMCSGAVYKNHACCYL